MSKDEYEGFQGRVFDEIRDLQDAEGNSERKDVRWALKIAAIYGMSEEEAMSLRKPGMKHVDWMRAIDVAGKDKR
jgi:hypothetical protein